MSVPPFTFNADLVSAQMRHAVERLKAISDISRAINSPLRPREEVLAMIVSSAAQLLEAELSWLGEFEGDSSRYQFSAGTERGAEPGVGAELGPEFAGWFELGHGPVGQAIRQGQPVQFSDIERDLAGAPAAPYQQRGWSMRATLGRRGIRSVLIVPMLSHGRLLGFLGVGSRGPRDFSAEEIDLLRILADHSAVAIENGRLYQHERDRELQAQNVLEVTRAVSSSLILRDVLVQAANGLANSVTLPNCVIYLYEPDQDRFVMQHAVGHQVEERSDVWESGLSLSANDDAFIQELVDKRRPIVVRNVGEDERLAGSSPALAGAKSVLAVPFIARDQLLGLALLATYRRQYEFQPEQVTLAMSIAHSVALAIENARLYEQTREMTVAEERNRMAREIHDTLAQGFTGIVLQLEAAEQVLPVQPDSALSHIDKAKTLARKSLQEARRSVWNLVPGPLENFSVDDALLQEVQELGASTNVEASFDCTGSPHLLPVDTQACLLRVCQEALNNVRKHAGASHVEVSLEWLDGGVRLTVRDDGRGFDPSRPRVAGAPGGFGLIGMRERCRLQHGTLTIQSEQGRGTTIEAFLPRKDDGQ